MNRNSLFGSIGLAMRAGKIISGEDQVLDAIKKKRAFLVFLANDAGFNTTKRITDKSGFYSIQLSTELNTQELSNCIGKDNRKVIAIIDRRFANMIVEAINEI